MVNADDAQRRTLGASRQGDGYSRLVEGGGDIIHGNGVVRVGAVISSKVSCAVSSASRTNDLRISADIADDRQSAVR